MGTLIGLRRSVGHTYAALAAEHGLAVEAAAIDRAFPTVFRQAPPLAFPAWGERRWRRRSGSGGGSGSRRPCSGPGGSPPPPSSGGPVRALRRSGPLAGLPGRAPLPRALAPGGTPSGGGEQLRPAAAAPAGGPWPPPLAGGGGGLQCGRCGQALPLPFHQALERLGVEARHSWHVGDSREDAEGAAAAGLRSIRIARP